jgi:TonB-dependent receptor
MSKRMVRKRLLQIFVMTFISLWSGTVLAQYATIVGTVTDKEDKSPLPSAAIIVKGTTIGTIADINGKYTLTRVPLGKQQIDFSYLGYQSQLFTINAVAGNPIELHVTLNADAIQGLEVVITGQAKGQTQAINQQLNAPGIVNIVSIEKMKELPDANAAEAVGRLPGVMVQRNGGEGEKVIIRGLDPKYSTVAVNGVVAPSSSSTDRSTNMNLISPEIISGIEVMKANTADRDADGMGGTVNMLVKEADKDRKLNITGQGGYSGQLKEFSNFKGVLFYNDRFFNSKLGLMLAGNMESYDRSSDQLRVSYDVSGDPVPPAFYVQPYITNEKLESNIERRNRYNASAIFDFSPAIGHTIKMVNMFSQTNRDSYSRQKGFSFDNGQLRFSQTDFKQTSWMLSNAINGVHKIGTTELIWSASRSHTDSRSPDQHTFEFRHTGGFAIPPATVSLMDPLDVPNPVNLNEKMNVYNLYQGILLDTQNKETEWSASLDYKIPFSFLAKQVSGFLKVGGKARFKDRERNTDRWSRRLDLNSGLNAIKDKGQYELSSSGGLGVMSFLDPNFQTTRFLNGFGQYLDVNYALDRQKVKDFYNQNNPDERGAAANLYQYTPAAKVKDDYKGTEDMYAFYLMGEFNIGRMITFIPGVRYDYSYVNYMAYKGDDVPDSYDAVNPEIKVEEQWAHFKQDYFLPQIHLKVKPLSWFDVRLAYTKTLSRPDYDYMAPRAQISPTSGTVIYSTPALRSSLSENLDLILSFYKPKLGLLTIGAFRKNIENFIYKRSAIMTNETDTDPANFNLPTTIAGYTITYPKNNTAQSYINGLEIEGQTNFRWAPQPLTGVVLSGNLTFMHSQSSYSATLFQSIPNPNFGNINPTTGTVDRRRNILTNKDTAYVDRLVKQPSLLANISLGYDIKGFSARLSFSHQANILNEPQTRPDGADKEVTIAFSRWDLQLKQKIFKQVSLFFNMTNIFNCPDRAIREVTGYYSAVEYYGMGANLGIKFDFF